MQAYKKLAMQWHPDKFQDEEDKKTAEKKFMDIAAAKEVLLDEGTYATLVKQCFILQTSLFLNLKILNCWFVRTLGVPAYRYHLTTCMDSELKTLFSLACTELTCSGYF